MLTQIEIRNFAIVEQLSIDFSAGMTVLTGETGAGKSILINALNLALGDRADADFVRSGAEKCEIAVNFDIRHKPAIQAWLTQLALDAEGECQIRRVLTQEGRSKGFINNSLVPSQSLRTLGDMLIDVQGQHQNQALLRRDYQRDLLDEFGKNQILRQNLATIHQDWRKNRERLEQLQGGTDEQQSRIELLQYQLDEMIALELDADELANINLEFTTLTHAREWIQQCEDALDKLYEDERGAIHSRLTQSITGLEPIIQIDASLQPCGELLNSALIQIEEAVQMIRDFQSRLELDPQRLEWIEGRIEDMERIARKHRVRAQDLPELQKSLSQELHHLLHANDEIQRIEAEQQALLKRYQAEGKQLHEKRVKTAKKLSVDISARMQRLGMKGGKLAIEVIAKKDDALSPNGSDDIQFLVSPNPGQPLKPLTKIVSGGELSRISLAIHVIAASDEGPETLIFDEVDTGVGGEIADCIGKELQLLGQHHQVICITHLPQVASFGQHHLQVSKSSSKTQTETRVLALSSQERVDEIARMLGGGKSAHQHGQAMLERNRDVTA